MVVRVCAAVMLVMTSIAFPPLFFLTGPLIFGWFGKTGYRAHKMIGQRNAFIQYQTGVMANQAEQRRIAAFRAF